MFILLFRLVQNNGFTYLLDFNIYFLFYLILIICSILLSNTFIIFIFKFYLNFKKYYQILNEINFFYNPMVNHTNNAFKPIIFQFNGQTRSFSTSSLNKNNNDPDYEQNNLEYNSDQSLKKQLKDFKKAYGGGYLGYTHIYNFGNIIQFTSYSNDLEFETCKANLESKLKDYVYVIPETETFSILPVLRWHLSEGEFRSLTISDSIKINKNINIYKLAETIIYDIKNIFYKYNLIQGDLELYIMGRPWLSVDEFNLDRENLSYLLDDVIEKKLSYWTKSLNPKDSSAKVLGLNFIYIKIFIWIIKVILF